MIQLIYRRFKKYRESIMAFYTYIYIYQIAYATMISTPVTENRLKHLRLFHIIVIIYSSPPQLEISVYEGKKPDEPYTGE